MGSLGGAHENGTITYVVEKAIHTTSIQRIQIHSTPIQKTNASIRLQISCPEWQLKQIITKASSKNFTNASIMYT